MQELTNLKTMAEMVTTNTLISINKEKFTWIPFYKEFAQKLLQFSSDRSGLLKIIYSNRTELLANYLHDNGGVADPLEDIDPFTTMGLFNRGIKQHNRVHSLELFKKLLGISASVPEDFEGTPVLNNQKSHFFGFRQHRKNDDIQNLWNLFIKAVNHEDFEREFNTVISQYIINVNITMGLFWIRPDDYLAFDAKNILYLKNRYGITIPSKVPLYAEYISILDDIKKKMELNEIIENSFYELSANANNWNLSEDSSNNSSDSMKCWLVGYSFGGDGSQLGRFFEEEVWEGVFKDNKKSDQKLLQIAKTVHKGDVLILKSTSTKGSNHDKPFIRVKGLGVVGDNTSVMHKDNYTIFRCNVRYISRDEVDFNGASYGAYRKTIHPVDTKTQAIVDYVKKIMKPITIEAKSSKYQKYIDLLKENNNLVLTGAPGTGKTFMAQAIAKEMGCTKEEMCFVQFHPSYDYTDFVEGLRPVEKDDGQIGFERKDGVFKEFCKKAIKNIIDSQKSVESLNKELSWEDKLQQFVEAAIDNGTKFNLLNGNEFTIGEIKERSMVIHNNQNEKITRISVYTDDIIQLLINEVQLNIVRDVRDFFNRKYGTQSDSYAFVITKAIRKMKTKANTLSTDRRVERKPFVFIIDEINRGEASKIFGELFYAIDPGYRGMSEIRVNTQYQNLVPESDVFAKGFYVPENVYILATMNDIDRSVESMDFAMRRRFAWKEITPTDTLSMLNTLPCADEVKDTMHRLNKVIAQTDGLGAAYMVGASYFLKLGKSGGNIEKLWAMNIEPLLKEYLRGFRKADDILEDCKNAYFGDKNESSVTDELDEQVEL